ncbi:hypothetical protein ABH931_007244 [Streptacidiphilus sp. MAP12-33]|uniref:hypothetical protein n=1 Tax=Streptacidiphilus sp. MAP12-33 TaxID=3156266 RepID=UPI003518C9EB
MSDAAWPPVRRPLGPAGPLPGPPRAPDDVAAPPVAAAVAVPAPGPGVAFPGRVSATAAAQGVAPTPAAPGVVETGHAGVDAALARLASAGDVPAEARAEVYGEVHDLLRDTLAGLDERPAGPPNPAHMNR